MGKRPQLPSLLASHFRFRGLLRLWIQRRQRLAVQIEPVQRIIGEQPNDPKHLPKNPHPLLLQALGADSQRIRQSHRQQTGVLFPGPQPPPGHHLRPEQILFLRRQPNKSPDPNRSLLRAIPLDSIGRRQR